MVKSASSEGLETIKDIFCNGQLAETTFVPDIAGKVSELTTDDFTGQKIFG